MKNLDIIIDSVKDEIENKLKVFEDPEFTFEEETHVYKYAGVQFDSVTTFIKKFIPEFNREYWSKIKAEERKVDPSVILKEWDDKAKKAARIGTEVHKYIENFWSGIEQETPTDPEVYKRIVNFLDVYHRKLKAFHPLKSELRVFSKKWRISGTIDQPLLFWDSKLNSVLLVIGDWKSNEEFRDNNHPKGRYNKLFRPFSHLYANHHNEYSIQISLYRLILKEEANIDTHGGFLCHIGPEDSKIYPVLDLREPLKAYLDDNRNFQSSKNDIFDI